jgi:ubiquitin-protein ligase
MSIRAKRLANDHASLMERIAASGGTLELAVAEGSPPERYELLWYCPGVVALQGEEPMLVGCHRVEITLGLDYPRTEPQARFLTPVVHPNVFPDGRICLGFAWTMAETLSELVLRIGRLIQYDPEILNLESPADARAASWAHRHRDRFPFGHETFHVEPGKRRAGVLSWEEL